VKDCATNKLRFETQTPLALEVAFDGGRLTSDGGLLWLSEVDEELGLCEVMAKHVPEWRKRRGHHSLVALLKQRVLQIACGYEDQNDANTLRADPLLKLVCGSLPETGADLASQPTISRLENAVSARACYLMAEALFELYLRERANKNGAPKKVLLDLDSTADPPPPTAIRKAATTTVTTSTTSTIPCSFSTARVLSSSRPSYEPATPTPAALQWPS
jgi:DDE family transposase